MYPEVKALIEHYNFKTLPVEGTFYTETYTSDRELDSGRPLTNAMIGMYCDEPRSVSLFHKLPADEIWHFYAGDPLRLVLLYPEGSSMDVILGNEPLKGQSVQFVVPAGVWQAGHMLPGGRYSLFGCTMAPGFTGDTFEGGIRGQLIKDYPDRADDINLLGCNPDQSRMPAGFTV